MENEHLKTCIEHLKSKLVTLTGSIERSKDEMISMYHTAKEYEANNTRLRHALRLCQQACDVYDILLEYKSVESSRHHHGSVNSAYYPSSFDSSLDTSTVRSPDREVLLVRNSLPGRIRSLLSQLEANPDLQNYLPYSKHGRSNGDYHNNGHSHWSLGNLSQNTGTTSGLSSMSGCTDIEVTPSDLERLKQYSQALLHYEKHLVSSLAKVDGLNGIETVKKPEVISDSSVSSSAEQGSGGNRGGEVTDMEDAANAEELCKVREEKAELRVSMLLLLLLLFSD